MAESQILYHEKQEAGLCAVHCLNSLLQGSYFTEIDLMQFAQRLDAREREMMQESGTDSADYLKYIAEDSGNVADDGNFSVQTLAEALKVWNLECVTMNSPNMAAIREDPLLAESFICNLSEHWFTIRRIRFRTPPANAEDPSSAWYNFNSLLPAPQILSDFYLKLYLATLVEEGYTIFVLIGDLPPANPPWQVENNWKLPATKEQIRIYQERAGGLSKQEHQALQDQFGGGTGGGAGRSNEEDDIARAIAMSLQDSNGGGSSGGPNVFNDNRSNSGSLGFVGAGADLDADDDLQMALAASLMSRVDETQAVTAGGGDGDVGAGGGEGEGEDEGDVGGEEEYDEDDDDLQAAILLSQQLSGIAPATTPTTTTTTSTTPSPTSPPIATDDEDTDDDDDPSVPRTKLVFRMPSGDRLNLEVPNTHTIESVVRRILASGKIDAGVTADRVRLRQTYPPSVVADQGQTLLEAGLHPNAVLIVEYDT
eukprot:TRINITY_DN2791_c0_g1_i1.p1 TRINITY_DN2791_c0_g1~~TRINITY_DN2791_c0_g1_i1.p1  ORF type:complete len:482 (-),score=105.20 TRINITY_DN2791_c0_g1_i1:119-1564(-)